MLRRFNFIGGAFGWVWLVIVLLPIWFVVATSLKLSSQYFGTNPLAPPLPPTIQNFVTVFEYDFVQYLINSTVVNIAPGP